MSTQQGPHDRIEYRMSQSIGIADGLDPPQVSEEYYFDQRGDDDNSGRQ